MNPYLIAVIIIFCLIIACIIFAGYVIGKAEDDRTI
jgi:hypothetical protein